MAKILSKTTSIELSACGQILGLDPGGTTGVALVSFQNQTMALWTVEKWHSLEEVFGRLGPGDIVVAESFRLYPGMGRRLVWNDLVAAQVFGVIVYLAKQAGVDIVAQPAAMAKRIALVPRHKDLVGVSKHAKEALRHVIAFAKRMKIAPFEELKSMIEEVSSE